MLVKKKLESVLKLAKKLKVLGSREQLEYESLVRCSDESPSATTPTGFLAVYVGDEQQRFLVPMAFLSHPLFKMLLDKAYKEYGFEQRNGLVVPCSVSTFQKVLDAMDCSHGQFDLEKLVEEFI